MTTALPPAARGYLDELRRLLAGAPDRDLVVDGVARHIEDALGPGPADDARVRAVLDELGDPAVIAAEAVPEALPDATGVPAAPSAPFLQRRSGAVLTVVLLAVGGLAVPFVGWIVGLGLLWSSKGWRVLDKVLATAAPFACVVVLTALLTFVVDVAPGHLAVLLALLLNAVAVPLYLLPRFRPAGR